MRLSVSRRFVNTITILAALLISAVTIAITGCGSSTVDPRLLHAESIIEERPDSALAIVESIDTLSLASDRDKALYGLLLTQAHVKQNETFTDTTFIENAISYFDRPTILPPSTIDLLRKMKALHYKAQIKFYRYEYYEAMPSALESAAIAEEYGDNLWKARTMEMLSDLVHKSLCHSQATEYAKKACLYYQMADKTDNHRFALCDLGTRYINEKKYKIGISLIDSIITLAKGMPVDSMLLSYAYHAIVPGYIETNQLDKATYIMRELPKLGKYNYIDAYLYINYASAELLCNNLDNVKPYLLMADSIAYTNSDYGMIANINRLMYLCKGDYQNALIYTDSLLSIQNREITSLLNQSAITAQKDYYSHRAELSNAKSRRLSYLLILTIILTLSTLTIISLWYANRLKSKKIMIADQLNEIHKLNDTINRDIAEFHDLTDKLSQKDTSLHLLHSEMERKEEDIRQLKESFMQDYTSRESAIATLSATIESQKKDIISLNEYLRDSSDSSAKELRQMTEKMFITRSHTVNFLCTLSSYNNSPKKGEENLRNLISRELYKFKSTNDIDFIKETINSYTDNELDRISKHLGITDPEEIAFITLAYSGFSPNAISFYLGLNVKTVYTRKSRLIERISKSDIPDKEHIIFMLSQKT